MYAGLGPVGRALQPSTTPITPLQIQLRWVRFVKHQHDKPTRTAGHASAIHLLGRPDSTDSVLMVSDGMYLTYETVPSVERV